MICSGSRNHAPRAVCFRSDVFEGDRRSRRRGGGRSRRWWPSTAGTALGCRTAEQRVAGGRYIDRLERRNGRWGIVAQVCLVDWQSESTSLLTPGAIEFLTPIQTVSRDPSDASDERPLVVKRAAPTVRMKDPNGSPTGEFGSSGYPARRRPSGSVNQTLGRSVRHTGAARS